jgi:hypothetical protein
MLTSDAPNTTDPDRLYCAQCGAGPRESSECEWPTCGPFLTQAELNERRAAAAVQDGRVVEKLRHG